MAIADFTAKIGVCRAASGHRAGHVSHQVSEEAGLSGCGREGLGPDHNAGLGSVVSLRFGAHFGDTGRCVSCWVTELTELLVFHDWQGLESQGHLRIWCCIHVVCSAFGSK